MHDYPPLHIAGPEDLVHAVVQMLGTNPRESLVLVGVTDSEIAATVTVDLPAVALPGILPALFRSIRRSPATGVIAIVYSTTAADTSLLAEPLATTASWAGLELIAALRVQHGGVQPLHTHPRTVSTPMQRRTKRGRR